MNELIIFPGPFLYIHEAKDHLQIKDQVMSYIDNDSEKIPLVDHEYEKVKSSFYNNRQQFFEFLKENDLLNKIVWDALDQCIEKFPFHISSRIDHSHITQIWYNYYENGGHHKEHTHSNSTFSGVYILHSEEPNKTVFFGQGAGNCKYQRFCYDTSHVTEGHVLIFPSEMYHRVKEVEKKRVIISFNITSY